MATKKPSSKGVANKDLQAARNELKQFRHDVSILKRKGLLDKSIDARSIKPTKYLKSQVKRFGIVLRGEASPVKVTKQTRAQLKSRGFDIKGERAIVPHLPGEKVRATRGTYKVVTPTRDGGRIEKLDLALDPDDINQWIDDLRNNRMRVGDDEELMFQLRGYNSLRGFGKIGKGGKSPQEQMADYLEGYKIIQSTMDGRTDDQETIDSIIVFKVKRGDRPSPNPGIEHRDEETRRRYRDRARRARELRLGRMSDKSYDEYTRERAEREKQRRAQMTDAEREAYKAKAKARAKASRDKRKK